MGDLKKLVWYMEHCYVKWREGEEQRLMPETVFVMVQKFKIQRLLETDPIQIATCRCICFSSQTAIINIINSFQLFMHYIVEGVY